MSYAEGQQVPDLSDYLAVLRRRKLLILLLVLLGGAAGAARAAATQPIYTATARVLVSPKSDTAAPIAVVSMATERDIVLSPALAELAANRLTGEGDPENLLSNVSADSSAESLVLDISYSDTDPDRARDGAKAFSSAYIAFRSSERRLDVEILAQPSLPTSPSAPNIPFDVGLGMFIGLFLGLIAAFIRDRTDRRIREIADIESVVGVPVLAIFGKGRKRRRDQLVAATKPDSPTAAPYRTLAAGLAKAIDRQNIRSILIAGVSDERSISSTAANVSVVLAQMGARVVLVSGNVRNARVHTFFGKKNERGLGDALTRRSTLSEVAQTTEVDGLRVLPAGNAEPGAVLVGGDSMRRVLAALAVEADLIVIDAPALAGFADGVLLAQLVDAVVLLVSSSDRRAEVARALLDLGTAEAPLVGTVLTGGRWNADTSALAAYPTINRSRSPEPAPPPPAAAHSRRSP